MVLASIFTGAVQASKVCAVMGIYIDTAHKVVDAVKYGDRGCFGVDVEVFTAVVYKPG